jgi:phospholipid N-methyltransferase
VQVVWSQIETSTEWNPGDGAFTVMVLAAMSTEAQLRLVLEVNSFESMSL